MLVDEVEIVLRAGHGGPGKVSFFTKGQRGPDGGSGGSGGSIYITATSDLMALGRFAHKKIWEAENGHPGLSNRQSGLNGKDITFAFPVGTEIIDKFSQEKFLVSETPLLICPGGKGGLGNAGPSVGEKYHPHGSPDGTSWPRAQSFISPQTIG